VGCILTLCSDRAYIVDTNTDNCEHDGRGPSTHKVCLPEFPDRAFWIYNIDHSYEGISHVSFHYVKYIKRGTKTNSQRMRMLEHRQVFILLTRRIRSLTASQPKILCVHRYSCIGTTLPKPSKRSTWTSLPRYFVRKVSRTI
jgi:hypothetical protein